MPFMKMFSIIALLTTAGLGLYAAGLEVEPDKENIVSSRLEGEWILDATLNERLGGRVNHIRSVSFVSDSEIATMVPEKYEQAFADLPVYMSGTMQLQDKAHPFVLTRLHGNPHLVYFREQGGDPMGDAESFNLSLAPAKDRANDILLLGGDFNNEPFRAFQRKELKTTSVPQDRSQHTTPTAVVEAWFLAVENKNADAAYALGTVEWAKKERKWKSSFSRAIFVEGIAFESYEFQETEINDDGSASIRVRAIMLRPDGSTDGEGMSFSLVRQDGAWLISELL